MELSNRRMVDDGMAALSNHRIVRGWNGGIVESSNRSIVDGGVVEWGSFRMWWNGGMVDSSNLRTVDGGMVELSNRPIDELLNHGGMVELSNRRMVDLSNRRSVAAAIGAVIPPEAMTQTSPAIISSSLPSFPSLPSPSPFMRVSGGPPPKSL